MQRAVPAERPAQKPFATRFIFPALSGQALFLSASLLALLGLEGSLCSVLGRVGGETSPTAWRTALAGAVDESCPHGERA